MNNFRQYFGLTDSLVQAALKVNEEFTLAKSEDDARKRLSQLHPNKVKMIHDVHLQKQQRGGVLSPREQYEYDAARKMLKSSHKEYEKIGNQAFLGGGTVGTERRVFQKEEEIFFESEMKDYKLKHVQGLYHYTHYEHPNGNWIQSLNDKHRPEYVHFTKSTGDMKKFDDVKDLKKFVNGITEEKKEVAEEVEETKSSSAKLTSIIAKARELHEQHLLNEGGRRIHAQYKVSTSEQARKLVDKYRNLAQTADSPTGRARNLAIAAKYARIAKSLDEQNNQETLEEKLLYVTMRKGHKGTVAEGKKMAETINGEHVHTKHYKFGDQANGTVHVIRASNALADHVLRNKHNNISIIFTEEEQYNQYITEAQRGRPRKVVDPDGNETEQQGKEHIIIQLRKVVNLKGNKDVEFDDDKKQPISVTHARTALTKYMQHKDKENYQKKLSASHDSFMQAIGGN